MFIIVVGPIHKLVFQSNLTQVSGPTALLTCYLPSIFTPPPPSGSITTQTFSLHQYSGVSCYTSWHT